MVLECVLTFPLFLCAAALFVALHVKQWLEPQVVRPMLPPHFCHPCREGLLISSDSMSEEGTFPKWCWNVDLPVNLCFIFGSSS